MAKVGTTKAEQHYTPQEVAAILSVDKQWVLDQLKPGGIWPFRALNARLYRIPESSVVAFLEARTLKDIAK